MSYKGEPKTKLTSRINERRSAMGPNAQTQRANGKISVFISSKPKVPAEARILIVSDDDCLTERVNIVLKEAGFISECAESITSGCEAAKSGRFQVIISAPTLGDGSWRRLVDIARHYDLGFVVVLLASSLTSRNGTKRWKTGRSMS